MEKTGRKVLLPPQTLWFWCFDQILDQSRCSPVYTEDSQSSDWIYLQTIAILILVDQKAHSFTNPCVRTSFVQRQISSAIVEVQEAVLQQEPRLAKATIPVPSLHVTLLVTYLANQEQVDLWVDTNTQTTQHIYRSHHARIFTVTKRWNFEL